ARCSCAVFTLFMVTFDHLFIFIYSQLLPFQFHFHSGIRLDPSFASGNAKLQGFFCLNLIVVQEEKTWEEALEHCRENHDDLTSLLSETENLLAQREIQDPTVTQRVWVGLRFLGDTWLWVNGDPLEFQAWNQTGDPDQQNPVQKRCGALSKQGEWENRDCQEKLNFICI
uniref:C-type lectin domain-containing protein n=1 Tax=Oryzias latipes TaxID=8090 RepID=A0A3P9MJ99_ORYLA